MYRIWILVLVTLLLVSCGTPAPAHLSLLSISPNSVNTPPSQSFTLVVVGTGFQSDAKIGFGGNVITPATITSTKILVVIPPSAFDDDDAFPLSVLVVQNNQVSNILGFYVTCCDEIPNENYNYR